MTGETEEGRAYRELGYIETESENRARSEKSCTKHTGLENIFEMLREICTPYNPLRVELELYTYTLFVFESPSPIIANL